MDFDVRCGARLTDGMGLLRARRYAEGWPLYEARRERPAQGRPLPDCPEWQGESLAGKRLLVMPEQGLGDQVMFGRYLGALHDIGAEPVIVCDPRFVARLFEAAGYQTRPYFSNRPLPPADYWAPFGSLPLRLGAGPPPPARYLDLPRPRTGGVGVMVAGDSTFVHDARRSLPPAYAERLLALGRDLRPAATGALDFLDTAQIVAGLDVVVTVDTALAHIAGAVGTPAIVLLPDGWRDFRWNDGRRSDWYPDFTLLRQASPGDWESVFDRLEPLLERAA